MCGISGIINFAENNYVSARDIETMNRAMLHRGPDAGGVHTDDNIGLGHRRLKIIDLTGGVQPMYNDDNSIVIVFNGEVYNFRSLRNSLRSRGHTFNTDSDTEVILRAYEEYGDRCADYFEGMFAFAIFDSNKRRLLLTRDRLGIKPLYYYIDRNRLVFASAIKPILSVLGAKPDANVGALDYYMSVGYVPGEETLFQDIKKLLPGYQLILEGEKLRFHQYWDLANTRQLQLSFDDALKRFESLAKRSVEMQMVSDVPIGAFLSGGLDSSAIVALMSEFSSERVKTFSVGYVDAPEASELPYAKIVADHFNTEHHEYILEPMGFFNSLDVLLEHTEEPIVESAAIALYQLSLLAKEHVTVILSGEGGDEILAGYPLHKITPKVDQVYQIMRKVPDFIKSPLGNTFIKSEKQKKYWDWINLATHSRYQSISNDVTRSIKEEMYQSPLLLDRHEETSEYYQRLFSHMSQASQLRKMTYTDIKTWLPDDLLVKADKMTMAASLELRVPFLEHKLLEYATALPDEYRLNGNEGKYMLKKFMEARLPPEIIYRKKKGFPVPISNWFRTSLYEEIRGILLDRKTLERGYFQPSYIENVLERHRSGAEDLSRRLFSLVNLELWHRMYLSGLWLGFCAFFSKLHSDMEPLYAVL